jgi:uncharacterized membrane-anchored protein YjiN (DUF445 family)
MPLEYTTPVNQVGQGNIKVLISDPPVFRRGRIRKLVQAAIIKACRLTDEEKRVEQQLKQATADRIAESLRRDEKNKAVARNIIATAKRDFAQRYPRIQESRILKSMREARELLDEIGTTTPQPQKLRKLFRYCPSHRFCLTACGPECPARLFTPPPVFYDPGMRWRN